MANSKGNRYPLWAIEVDGTVVAYDAMATRHEMSQATFATQISVSDDGTVWIVSFNTDPSGGGLKIFFSNGTDKMAGSRRGRARGSENCWNKQWGLCDI